MKKKKRKSKTLCAEKIHWNGDALLRFSDFPWLLNFNQHFWIIYDLKVAKQQTINADKVYTPLEMKIMIFTTPLLYEAGFTAFQKLRANKEV